MKLFITAILLTVSLSSVAESYSFNEDIITQQLKIEQEQKEQREQRKQIENLEYAEQQRYLRQAEQDARIRQMEDEQQEQEQQKRRWPEPFDVKHGY